MTRAAAGVAFDDREKFGVVEGARRVWTVGAVHGELAHLSALHGVLEARFARGDRLVYLGNYLGRGADVIATIDELLLFRRALLARFTLFDKDIVFLRGAQEEMWQKLLQIQIAQDPAQVLEWVLAQGVDATLRAYGVHPDEARLRCREGPLALARWSLEVRQAIRGHPGHETLLAALRRAALTADGRLLFVHAGVDPTRPLAAQSDSFWWGSRGFSVIDRPHEGFRRIVRGYDPSHSGLAIGEVTATIDSGCGFGGPLTAACIDSAGEVVDLIEA
jgi:serine/threonine protein phosphatase 1